MDFKFTPEEEKLAKEVRDFLLSDPVLMREAAEEVDSHLGFGPASWKIVRKLGEKRWLAPTWPYEYGGMNATYLQRFIIHEEITYQGGPFGLVGAGMAGPVILRQGTEEQKKEYLPKIASGEIDFALGYTEPNAGSDLTALDIRAEDKGDYFLCNGQKVYNTSCHFAQYHWLGARTDPKASPRHKGISLFVVDMKSPGITVRPLWTMMGGRTNEVFYEDVKVPKKNLVGKLNSGWYYIAEALNFERIYIIGRIRRTSDHIVHYAKETKSNGETLSKNPIIRQSLAEMDIELEIAYLLSARVAWLLDRGKIPDYEAAMGKMFATEVEARVANVVMRILGLYGQLQKGAKYAPFEGNFERHYRDSVRPTITRGSSEIMRNLVALRGLGLPRQ